MAREIKHLHDNGDGTFSFWCALVDGGREAIQVKMPPLLRRIGINNLVADAHASGDLYLWQVAQAACVGLGYVPGGRPVEFPSPMPSDIQELGNACADALYAAGFDVFSEDYAHGASDLLAAVIESLLGPEREADAAEQAAAEVFPEEEEGTQP